MIYNLSFRNNGGAVVPGRLTAHPPGSREVPIEGALIGYDQVTFLIHGFNVNEEEGIKSLSVLAELLPSALPGAIVFVLWPGDSPIGPLSYSFTEGHQADDTADELVKFIISHMTLTTPINIIAHSLGCRVTMETAKKLHNMANGQKTIYPVKQICLMAGAIDDFSLSEPDDFRAAAERADRVAVLSSVEDEVLGLIYPLGDLIQAFIFFWKESAGMALGYRGPIAVKSWFGGETHSIPGNVHPEPILENFGIDHGDYLPPDKKNRDEWSAAAAFADAVVAGVKDLQYQLQAKP